MQAHAEHQYDLASFIIKLTRYASQCACCEQKGADVKLQACSGCTTTYYCSTTCQKQDWKQHKQTCQPPPPPPPVVVVDDKDV